MLKSGGALAERVDEEEEKSITFKSNKSSSMKAIKKQSTQEFSKNNSKSALNSQVYKNKIIENFEEEEMQLSRKSSRND